MWTRLISYYLDENSLLCQNKAAQANKIGSSFFSFAFRLMNVRSSISENNIESTAIQVGREKGRKKANHVGKGGGLKREFKSSYLDITFSVSVLSQSEAIIVKCVKF